MPFALDDLDSNCCRVSTIPESLGSFRTLVSMVEDIAPEQRGAGALNHLCLNQEPHADVRDSKKP